MENANQNRLALRLKTLPLLERKDQLPAWLMFAEDEAGYAGESDLWEIDNNSLALSSLWCRVDKVNIDLGLENEPESFKELYQCLKIWAEPCSTNEQVGAFNRLIGTRVFPGELPYSFITRILRLVESAAIPETPEILKRVVLPVIQRELKIEGLRELPQNIDTGSDLRSWIVESFDSAREKDDLPPLPRSGLPRLVFLRHGETDWNVDRRMQGSTDIPLNERGRAQAKEVAKALQLEGAVFDRIISSDLSRARETAEIIAEVQADHLGQNPLLVATLTEFRERSMGPLEGMVYQDARERMIHDGYNSLMDYGESRRDLVRRLDLGVHKIASEASHSGDRTILVVSHGGALAQLFKHLAFSKGVGRRFVQDSWDQRLGNCSVTIIDRGEFRCYANQLTEAIVREKDLV